MNNYKVCILTAGVGSRMGSLAQHVNKAILPVNFKAVISHIIEKFSKEIEIVVAVGHKKDTVVDYIQCAHPERPITFVEINEFVGPGTGPGYSLLQCKEHLQTPFIYFSADTLVLEEIPAPDKNWFGVAPVKNTEHYCTVKVRNNLIYQIDDKVKTNNRFAFIGLAGVYDYELFFSELEKNKELIKGEVQVSNGFNSLIEKQLVPIGFTWFDTGTLKKYIATNKNFSGGQEGFDYGKDNEFLYFVGDKVIKFFADEQIAKERVVRSQMLKGTTPEIIDSRKHFYVYQKKDGQTLYSILNNKLIKDFLIWCQDYLWDCQELSEEADGEFQAACKEFYYAKTIKRLILFYKKTGISDGQHTINGTDVPSIDEMFKRIDFHALCDGVPSTIHGDLQFDNVLVTKKWETPKDQFVLLDWRHNFGGLIQYGDLYYDLAKMYGGLNLSYYLIKKEGKFSVDISGSHAFYKYYVSNDVIEAKEEYERYLLNSGYDLEKVKIITSLIYLNMSPLHHAPYDQLLFFLGKKTLNDCLEVYQANARRTDPTQVINSALKF